MGSPFLSPFTLLFWRDGHLGQLIVTRRPLPMVLPILRFSAASSGGCFVLHQGAWRRTVLQTGALSCALVGYHLKPVVKVLELGVYCPHRADFPAETTSNTIVLADVNLHSIPVRFNLPAPDP